jgi:hypothetical protein
MGVNYIPEKSDSFRVKGSNVVYVCTEIVGNDMWPLIECRPKETSDIKSFPVKATFFEEVNETK